MLSRLAESFFWLSRNIERAETVARVLDVTYTDSMDIYGGGAWSLRSWRTAVAIATLSSAAAVVLDELPAKGAIERCAFDPTNPSSIVTSVRIARANGVGARAELSTEVWEHLNELYLQVQKETLDSVWREGTSPFLRRARDRCQAIAGVSDATLSHVDGWNFLQVGRYLERGYVTARMLATLESIDDPWPEWQRLLEMCCASVPFARTASRLQHAGDAVAFLLFSPTLPRSLRVCVNEVDAALHGISGSPARAYANEAEKLAGRLATDVNFTDFVDVQDEVFHLFLRRTIASFESLVRAIENVYFPHIPAVPMPMSCSEVAPA
ncbi:MAG: alpha-E domain-containing protein [Vulcanimicrobiaceae bacterium]